MYCTRRISGITFIMYSHSQKIGRKQNSCTKMFHVFTKMLSKLVQEKFEDSSNQKP